MKKDIKQARIKLWIDALRSGEYKQGRGALVTNDRLDGFSHCCLGVACEVYIKHAKKGGLSRFDGDSKNEAGFLEKPFRKNVNRGYLPEIVMNWFGFVNPNPTLIDKENVSCANANDSHDLTFNQIADALEKKYVQ